MWQVVGQPKAVELLRRSVEAGRLSHAYLFVGRRHVGKMTLALELARAVNCEAEERPCGQCSSCARILAGNHADIQVVAKLAAENSNNGSLKKEIGIGQIRELGRAASLRPYEGRYRVFIIDGAEYLNQESANCLLKTLEEPPPNVILALLASSDSALLPTITSRCQRVGLLPVPAPLIEQELVSRRGVEAEQARVLSRVCRGAIGWAISAATSGSLLEERRHSLDELIGLINSDLDGRFAYAAQLAAQFGRSRDSIFVALERWLGWWRDVLLVREGAAEFVADVDYLDMLQRQATSFTLAEIRGAMEAIKRAAEELERNANPRLVLEVLMLDLPSRRGLGVPEAEVRYG